MYDWIFAAIIVFVASVLQAATGFGFAIMATPFLLLVFNSRDCIQMSIFLSFFIAIVLTPKIKHQIDLALLKRLILGSFFGIPVGLWFFSNVSIDLLKITVSIVILIATLFILAKWYQNFQVSSENHPDDFKNPKQPDEALNSTKRNELLVGLCAGALTTSIGMPGVPLALYFTATNTKKEVIRSTTLAFFIAVYTTSILSQLVTVKISSSVLLSSLLLVPAAAAGVFFGNLLFYKINQKMFQLIANAILLYTGVYMLIKTI